MVRLAVTKKTSTRSRVGYSLRRAAASKTSASAKASPSTAKKSLKTPSRTHSTNRFSSASVFVPRIRALIAQLSGYCDTRARQNGSSDPVCKKLGSINSSLRKELRKSNCLNPCLARSVQKIGPAIRGVSGIPQGIKMNAPQFGKYLSGLIYSDVSKFLTHWSKTLSPLHTELKNLEARLKKDVSRASGSHIQWRVNPVLVRRFNSLNTQYSKFYAKWNKHFNAFNTHGNRNIQTQVRGVKKHCEEIQGFLRRNSTLLARYGKTVKPRAGFQSKFLCTAGQAQSIESHFNHCGKELDNFRTQVGHYCDQLKAVKIF